MKVFFMFVPQIDVAQMHSRTPPVLQSLDEVPVVRTLIRRT
jgi:hypothetical protein